MQPLPFVVRLSESSARIGHYDADFYRRNASVALASARKIVPILQSFVRFRSVLDVGCGTGSWLKAFQENGVSDLLGIEGDWVTTVPLEIPRELVKFADVRRPLQLNRSFELVLCLEVAEHVGAESADTLIESLTRMSPVVLFSAAIPFQGGTDHINEQWPEYWCDKFAHCSYSVIDCIRSRVWNDPEVAWWYAQNILLFVSHRILEESEPLRALRPKILSPALSLVHPRKYLAATDPENITLWQVGRNLRSWLMNKRRRLR